VRKSSQYLDVPVGLPAYSPSVQQGLAVKDSEACTFLSLSFSVFSSLLAFAAWRLSCFAVNYVSIISALLKSAEICSHRRRMERKGNESPRCLRDKDGRTFKLKSAFSRPDMMDVVCETCI
jgi:hypothetical protein